MNLFLVGYRCTGKTTVGKALASRLGWPFMDTDRAIVKKYGAGIARMVDEKGWPYFREQERQVIAAASASHSQVVATGGGVVCDDRNILAMQSSGKVVWLRASRRTIAARMLADGATVDDRPSLTAQGLIGEIAALLTERTPLYAKAADLVIHTDRLTVTAIGDRIIEALGLRTEDN